MTPGGRLVTRGDANTTRTLGRAHSGKKTNAFWPVGFLSIFVVRERPQKMLSRKANCLMQLVLEKERDTQMEAFFTGIDFAEICSVKIARQKIPG